MKKGLLLINLGTPEQANKRAIIPYLIEFLTDKRVINLPVFLRFLLLYCFIIPFRINKTTHAYQAVWTKKGSPLLYNTQKLCAKVQLKLGENFDVVLGMRYGKPSIKEALIQLSHCENITILPLYPQYSSAATGSAIEYTLKCVASQTVFPSIKIIRDFCQEPLFIQAQAEKIKPYLNNTDYILFSYHGLPEQHLKQAGCNQICVKECNPSISACYRAQCLQTTSLIAAKLHLNANQFSSSFQSRLGKTPWIKPYTDTILSELMNKGIKRLTIVCPSFVADCLETLEEIGIQAKQQWLAMGGETFTLIPCLNDDELWTEAIVDIIRK